MAETEKEDIPPYTLEEAIAEAQRCLKCPKPMCRTGCPIENDIPAFNHAVSLGNFGEAASIIAQRRNLPAICGRVCPHENQCEGHCVLSRAGKGIKIGMIERFIADFDNELNLNREKKIEKVGGKVAVIGSGPSGLACAGDLAKKGYDVTVFEALHVAGGVLSYGIPEFRLPKSIVQKEINGLKELGVKIETNTVVGKSVSIDELMNNENFETVFIGSGAGLPRFMNIPGENLNGVYSANEFLTRINLMKAYKENSSTPVTAGSTAVIVGGGNVAMDSARCAKRLGAEVYIVYRRTSAELPARAEEIEHAKEEGIIFKFLTNPVEIKSDEKGWVKSIVCQQMELSEPDESGRAKPVPIPDSFIEIPTDCVIMSIGTSPNPLIKSTTEGLETQKWGGIIADENGLTSKKGVYAGGDAVTGAATVILAMGAGKKAAAAMDEYMKNNN